MLDMKGTEIKVGDTVAYAGKHANRSFIAWGVVDSYCRLADKVMVTVLETGSNSYRVNHAIRSGRERKVRVSNPCAILVMHERKAL